MRPEGVNAHLREVVTEYEEMLEKGAIVRVGERQIRLRSLPIELGR